MNELSRQPWVARRAAMLGVSVDDLAAAWENKMGAIHPTDDGIITELQKRGVTYDRRALAQLVCISFFVGFFVGALFMKLLF